MVAPLRQCDALPEIVASRSSRTCCSLLAGLFFVIGLGLGSPPAQAIPDLGRDSAVICDLTLLDHPFQTAFGSYPSMAQSLGASSCFYQWSHRSLIRLTPDQWETFWQRFRQYFVLSLFDAIATSVPLANTWLHEEYHRAVMAVRGIDSYNEVYELDLFAEVIQVSGVKDEQLIDLKLNHNQDLVRLAAAGIEGTLELNYDLQKKQFFDGITTYNNFLYIYNYIGVVSYVGSGTSDLSDRLKDERTDQDDPEERDFVGHDFTSWVYDLHRPNEPYQFRGTHPSGEGVDRYRGKRDLTDEEEKFLNLQGKLIWLNLVDPFWLNLSSFRWSDTTRWNFKLRHFLTSHGYTIDAVVLSRSPQWRQIVTLRGYRNAYRWYPGLEYELIRLPLTSKFSLSPRLAYWQQPRDQRFKTHSIAEGGMGSVTLHYEASENWESFLEVGGKTAGWLASNPYTDSVVETRTGVTVVF